MNKPAMNYLDEEDAKLFYKLNWALLYYANQKYGIIDGLKEPVLRKENPNKVNELSKNLFSHPEIIDSFISENPFNFSPEYMEIIKGWKNFIRERFTIMSHTRDYSIFLGGTETNPKAYGVVGISQPIGEIVSPFLPIMCETVLLPFKGRITFHGLIMTLHVHFGPGMRRTFHDDFQKAKSAFGIITSLGPQAQKNESADEEMLKYYLRSKERAWEHEDDIRALLKKSPALAGVYHQELAKSNSRTIKKKLRQNGITSGWFAVYDDIVIASGKSEDDVKNQITALLPEGKMDNVYIFRMDSGGKAL